MKSVTLNLVATEENDVDLYNDFEVEFETTNDIDLRKLINTVLREGIKAAREKGFRVFHPLFGCV